MMSGTSTSFGDGLGFAGIPGITSSYSIGNTLIVSESIDSAVGDISEDMSDFLSPTTLAQTSKKIWTDSSSWLVSRISYQSQSTTSSANSSIDCSPAPVGSGKWKNRDPTAVERSNLLNITKLVIKELIEWSIRHERSLESDHPPLQHFFIVLEHAMRHGLKPKKGLLGPKKELWDVLQMVEKCTNEALDITSSIRDLPTVSTHLGRARAWLRLALMQKKLADYVKVLLDCREDILREFYEPIALMMSDEATVLAGLLVGLNVIDCNFCLKEEDLDSQQGVIDFSLYLRSSRSSESADDEAEPSNMDSVLDQKNYIEELNRHLNATVTNLQTRVETLTTTNALMKEDLAISKNTILSFQNENQSLRLRLSHYTGGEEILNSDSLTTEKKIVKSSNLSIEGGAGDGDSLSIRKSVDDGSVIESAVAIIVESPVNLTVRDLSKKLHDERTQRAEFEKQMEIQANQKAEMEMAMKLMEKDVHEKQDTIITLRRQLDDIKTINLEMYRKLQECEKSLKYKTEFVAALESKAVKLGETIEGLNEKCTRCESELRLSHETMRSLGVQIADKELKVSTLEGDLRIEREWRQSLQDTVVKDKEKISELNMDVHELQLVGLELETIQQENSRLIKLCKEHEQTLADMGIRLSESTLRMEDLREASKAFAEGHWAHDKEVTNCRQCNKEFSITRRKHHCRNCGEIFCKLCSDNMMQLPSSAKPVRVCDFCYPLLLQRCSLSSPSVS